MGIATCIIDTSSDIKTFSSILLFLVNFFAMKFGGKSSTVLLVKRDFPLSLIPWILLSIYSIVTDDVYVLCFSLILLSVDMHSPHVKTKMSKREFIRNVRGAMTSQEGRSGHYDEMVGHMYDNIYLIGHIAAYSTSSEDNYNINNHNQPRNNNNNQNHPHPRWLSVFRVLRFSQNSPKLLCL